MGARGRARRGRRRADRRDRLRRRLPVRPVPARDGRDDPRRSTRTCCAATAKTSPRSGSAASSRRATSSGCSRCRSRRSSTAFSTATRLRTTTLPITTAITPDDAVLATFGDTRGTVVIGHTHHQFDRRSASCASSTPGSVGMAYEGDVAAYWTILDDGEPTFRRARRSTSSAPSPRCARAAGRTRRSSSTENLLVAVDRDEAIASLESRRAVRVADRQGRPPARDRRRVLRRAAVAPTSAGGRPARGSSPAGAPVEVVAHRHVVRAAR